MPKPKAQNLEQIAAKLVDAQVSLEALLPAIALKGLPQTQALIEAVQACERARERLLDMEHLESHARD